MRWLYATLTIIPLIFVGCNDQQNSNSRHDLESVKNDFIKTIFSSEVEEAPFNMHYSLKTTFFSKNLISLFGQINVYDSMPHGWKRFEGKTYAKSNGKFQEVTLHDLFTTKDQKEYLRSYCETRLKKDPITYFEGDKPYKTRLDFTDIKTFVIDDLHLIIIFQPYVAASSADSPIILKIPFSNIENYWNQANILYPILQRNIASNSYVCTLEDEPF